MADETETRHPLDGMVLTMHGDRLWWCDPEGKRPPILYKADNIDSTGMTLKCPHCEKWITIPGE